MSRSRLTDNDKSFGPFTLGERSKSWRPLGVSVESGCDEYPGCSLDLYAFGWHLRANLPQIISPWRRWVDTSGYAWANSASAGYWDVHTRKYGVSVSDGFLQVFLGPQTHDSSTTKNWNRHLPWTQWRFVRKSLYGLSGEHFWTEPTGRQVPRGDAWEQQQKMRDLCPKAVFEVEDYDGQRINVITTIEEWEWRFGEGWFKWLSIFRKPRIRRSLELKFEKEVGYEKGSWKGGLMGHGIDLLPGELHEAAMRRYCAAGVRNKSGVSKLTFVGWAP